MTCKLNTTANHDQVIIIIINLVSITHQQSTGGVECIFTHSTADITLIQRLLSPTLYRAALASFRSKSA